VGVCEHVVAAAGAGATGVCIAGNIRQMQLSLACLVFACLGLHGGCGNASSKVSIKLVLSPGHLMGGRSAQLQLLLQCASSQAYGTFTSGTSTTSPRPTSNLEGALQRPGGKGNLLEAEPDQIRPDQTSPRLVRSWNRRGEREHICAEATSQASLLHSLCARNPKTGLPRVELPSPSAPAPHGPGMTPTPLPPIGGRPRLAAGAWGEAPEGRAPSDSIPPSRPAVQGQAGGATVVGRPAARLHSIRGVRGRVATGTHGYALPFGWIRSYEWTAVAQQQGVAARAPVAYNLALPTHTVGHRERISARVLCGSYD